MNTGYRYVIAGAAAVVVTLFTFYFMNLLISGGGDTVLSSICGDRKRDRYAAGVSRCIRIDCRAGKSWQRNGKRNHGKRCYDNPIRGHSLREGARDEERCSTTHSDIRQVICVEIRKSMERSPHVEGFFFAAGL